MKNADAPPLILRKTGEESGMNTSLLVANEFGNTVPKASSDILQIYNFNFSFCIIQV
jgi:hypothetical protein